MFVNTCRVSVFKMKSEIQKRPYKKKFRCQNCKGFTDSPAYNSGKLYCQKCTVYRRVYGEVPDKQTVNDLKEAGRWKK